MGTEGNDNPTAGRPFSSGGNVYDKYASRHPIERRLVSRFLAGVEELADRSRAEVAHEVGCGEGELARRLARRGLEIRGSDIDPEVIVEARGRTRADRLGIAFQVAALEELSPEADSAELIICCEVLEHLPNPGDGLAAVTRLARPWVLLSVPREPLWRALNLARLKYIAELGNTPGHVNHFSRRSFIDFVSSRLEIVAVRSPLPWTMVLARASTPN